MGCSPFKLGMQEKKRFGLGSGTHRASELRQPGHVTRRKAFMNKVLQLCSRQHVRGGGNRVRTLKAGLLGRRMNRGSSILLTT